MDCFQLEISRVVTWIMSFGDLRHGIWLITTKSARKIGDRGKYECLSRQLNVTNVVLLRKCQSLQINLFNHFIFSCISSVGQFQSESNDISITCFSYRETIWMECFVWRLGLWVWVKSTDWLSSNKFRGACDWFRTMIKRFWILILFRVLLFYRIRRNHHQTSNFSVNRAQIRNALPFKLRCEICRKIPERRKTDISSDRNPPLMTRHDTFASDSAPHHQS